MKFNKILFSRLGLGLITVAVIGFGIIGYLRLGTSDKLQQDLQSREQTLASLTQRRENAKVQLAQVTANLNPAKAGANVSGANLTSQGFESIEYGEKLFAIAVANNLQITALSASPAATVNETGIQYLISNYNLSLSGKPDDLGKFVQTIAANNDFRNVAFENVNFAGLVSENSSIQMSFTVYVYKG